MSDVLVLNSDGTPLSTMPLSVIDWQSAIRLVFIDKVKVLSVYEGWVVRSPNTTMNVPSIVMMTDYIRWNRRIKYSRMNVFLRDNFECQLQSTSRCRMKVGKGYSINDLTVDHVIPKSFGGKTTWTNVTTACQDCNSHKGNDSRIKPKIKPYRPTYYNLVANRQKHPLVIRDLKWMTYLNWSDDLVEYQPKNTQAIGAQ